jgi:aldehyde dehydrogenase (NAD+)
MLRRMMQETPTISSNAATAETADRRFLIDGRLLETGRTFPSISAEVVSGAAS